MNHGSRHKSFREMGTWKSSETSEETEYLITIDLEKCYVMGKSRLEETQWKRVH